MDGSNQKLKQQKVRLLASEIILWLNLARCQEESFKRLQRKNKKQEPFPGDCVMLPAVLWGF